MKRIGKQIAIILVAACLCAAGCGGPKPDALLVRGGWKVVAGSENGKSFPKPEEQRGMIVVAGSEFEMYETPTSSPQKWTFRLDPTKSPKQIDFTLGDKTAPGIYELDGDHWKLAMITPGKPRPTDFQPAESTLVLDMKAGEPTPEPKPPADKPAY